MKKCPVPIREITVEVEVGEDGDRARATLRIGWEVQLMGNDRRLSPTSWARVAEAASFFAELKRDSEKVSA